MPEEDRPESRRAYVKPELVRVDLVESEVALRGCKFPTAIVRITTKGQNAIVKCKSTGTAPCNAQTLT